MIVMKGDVNMVFFGNSVPDLSSAAGNDILSAIGVLWKNGVVYFRRRPACFRTNCTVSVSNASDC